MLRVFLGGGGKWFGINFPYLFGKIRLFKKIKIVLTSNRIFFILNYNTSLKIFVSSLTGSKDTDAKSITLTAPLKKTHSNLYSLRKSFKKTKGQKLNFMLKSR